MSSSFLGALGGSLGVLLELNRNNIANDRDVESKLGLSLLGAVPLIKSEDKNVEGLGFSEYINNPDSQFSEAELQLGRAFQQILKKLYFFFLNGCKNFRGPLHAPE